MEDIILEISAYIPLKIARLLNKTVNNYNVDRYLRQFRSVTTDEINHYNKDHDIGISTQKNYCTFFNYEIYFDVNTSEIKVVSIDSLPSINSLYYHLDYISYYNILILRMDHSKVKTIAKNQVIAILQKELINIYSSDRMAFSSTYIRLAVNCHLMALQDINTINNTIIPFHNTKIQKAEVLKMYKMVMTYLQNL